MPQETIILDILLIVIGIIISLYGSIVGFGGGIFMIPILVTIFHYDLHIAVGAMMVSLLPSSLVSTFLHRKEGNVDFRIGMLLEVPTVVGVVIGSFLLSFISAKRLEVVFALMVVILGLTFLKSKTNKKSKKSGIFYKLNKTKPKLIVKNRIHHLAYRVSIWVVLFFGLLAGGLAGLFGIGGGFLQTPIMIKGFNMPVKVAAATSLFIIVITSITGIVSHYLQGNILLQKAWPIALGFTIGAVLGHKINLNVKDDFVEKMIGFGLILAGLIMISKFMMAR